jgi:hypothetical protein
VLQVGRVAVAEKGQRKDSLHVYAASRARENIKIKIARRDEAASIVKYETHGDQNVGLHTEELENVINEDSTQRFVPF